MINTRSTITGVTVARAAGVRSTSGMITAASVANNLGNSRHSAAYSNNLHRHIEAAPAPVEETETLAEEEEVSENVVEDVAEDAVEDEEEYEEVSVFRFVLDAIVDFVHRHVASIVWACIGIAAAAVCIAFAAYDLALIFGVSSVLAAGMAASMENDREEM